MSSLQVLEVLNRLREEGDKAAAAQSASKEQNRALKARIAALKEAAEQRKAKIQLLQTKERALDDATAAKKEALFEAQVRHDALKASWKRRRSDEERRVNGADAELDAFIARSDDFRREHATLLQRLQLQRSRLSGKKTELAQAEAETASADDGARRALEDLQKRRAALQEQLRRADEMELANAAVEAEALALERAARKEEASHAEASAMAASLSQRNRGLQSELRSLNRKEALARPKARYPPYNALLLGNEGQEDSMGSDSGPADRGVTTDRRGGGGGGGGAATGSFGYGPRGSGGGGASASGRNTRTLPPYTTASELLRSSHQAEPQPDAALKPRAGQREGRGGATNPYAR